MDMNLLMTQRWAIVQEIPSQLKNNGTLSSGWVNLALFGRLLGVIGCGALDTTLDFRIEAATDVLGTGLKTVKSIPQITNANAPLTDASTAATGVAATSGGNLPPGAYKAIYTWFNANGETLGSTESGAVTVAGAGNGSITWTLPSIPAGALGANVYMTLAAGANASERFVGQMLSGTTFVATAQPITANTTAVYNASPPPLTELLPAVPPVINTTGDIRRHSFINVRTPECGDGFNFARITAVAGNGATGANLHAELWATDSRFDPAENYNFAVRDVVR